MNAIEILRHEHVLVRKLLRCLGALTIETRVAGSVDATAARALLHLLERFVDWSHQDKEELHLFPHMLARATSEEAGRLARVFGEHAQERRRLVSMHLHMEGAARGHPASVDRFTTNSLLYQRLQNKHVEAEESFVLPLAEAILTTADDRRIRRGFREIDRRLGAHPRVEENIARLCLRFGLGAPTDRVPRPRLIRA
jgi:hemerythrin-like domain-containing protein